MTFVNLNPLGGALRVSSSHEGEIKLDYRSVKLRRWKIQRLGAQARKVQERDKVNTQDNDHHFPRCLRLRTSITIDSVNPSRTHLALLTEPDERRTSYLVRLTFVTMRRYARRPAGCSRAIKVDVWRSTVEFLDAIPFLCVLAGLARLPRVLMGFTTVAASERSITAYSCLLVLDPEKVAHGPGSPVELCSQRDKVF